MRFKIFTLVLTVLIIFPLCLPPVEANVKKSFKDVPEDYFAYTEINALVQRGIINGFTDETFRPKKTVSRGEFANFLSRALDLPAATSDFKDVSKSNALYDGISRANKAGIINGFSDGSFRPNVLVSRQEMAVMLDRGMQVKGVFNKRKELDFADRNSISSYAYESIERMYFYKVMWAHSHSRFEGSMIGTRAQSAKAIYQMLKELDGGKFKLPEIYSPPSKLTVEQIKKLDPLKLTYGDVIKAYGPYVVTARDDRFREVNGIVSQDIWKGYTEGYLKWAVEYNYPTVMGPEDWMAKEKENMKYWFGEVSTFYPNFELVAVNGKPYMTSELFGETATKIHNRILEIHNNIPVPPQQKDQFKIDIHYLKHDFATYYKDAVKTGKQTVLPYAKENKTLLVDAKSIFSTTPQVKLSKNKISYNGQTIEYTNGSKKIQVNGVEKELSVSPELKNGTQMLPIREVAAYLGLQTRVAKGTIVRKIEIQNYIELDPDGGFR